MTSINNWKSHEYILMTFEGVGELRKTDKVSGHCSYDWTGFSLKKW